jgi:hypothetical protein
MCIGGNSYHRAYRHLHFRQRNQSINLSLLALTWSAFTYYGVQSGGNLYGAMGGCANVSFLLEERGRTDRFFTRELQPRPSFTPSEA